MSGSRDRTTISNSIDVLSERVAGSQPIIRSFVDPLRAVLFKCLDFFIEANRRFGFGRVAGGQAFPMAYFGSLSIKCLFVQKFKRIVFVTTNDYLASIFLGRRFIFRVSNKQSLFWPFYFRTRFVQTDSITPQTAYFGSLQGRLQH